MIYDSRTPGTWKIQHIIRINFMSSKDSGEKRPYACKDITGDFSE